MVGCGKEGLVRHQAVFEELLQLPGHVTVEDKVHKFSVGSHVDRPLDYLHTRGYQTGKLEPSVCSDAVEGNQGCRK